MAKSIKERKEERGKLVTAMEELRAKFGDSITDEQRSQWNDLKKQVDAIDEQIKIEEEMEEVRAKYMRDKPTMPDDEKGEQRAALIAFLQTGEKRASLTIQNGKAIIPSFMANVIEKALKTTGSVMSVADVFVTTSGADLSYPTVNDTDSKATIVTEGAENSRGTKPLGSVVFKAYTYRTPTIPISYELLQDANFDIEALITDLMQDAFARGYNEHQTIGTGTNQPLGVVTAAAKAVEASAEAITYDNLVDLQVSLDAAYRSNAHWMFNSNTLGVLMKMVDANGRPIWVESVAEGASGKILGKPYVINEDMPDIGAGNKSVLFGDFKKYKVRAVRNVQISRLTELFAENACIGMLGFGRMDARLVDAGTHPIKAIEHASA